MTAITVNNSPAEAKRPGDHNPADFMPLMVRVKVAREINRAWEEFVNDMHDGPTFTSDAADKFWRYVTGT